MSKKPTTALTVPQRAVAALGYNEETRKELTTLAAGSAHIIEITNDDGYKQCHAARMALKNTRIEITKRGKTAREDAQAFSKAVIAEEIALIALIATEEDRLEKLQTDHDDRIEAEKQAKAAAELARVESLKERVAELRGNQALTIHDGSELISQHYEDLQQITVDESFEEYEQQAQDARLAGLTRLNTLYKAAVAHEAEQARLKAEAAQAEQLRKENEQLRAEKAERERVDREAVAKAEREAQAGRDEIARVERNRQENERKAQEPAVTRETTVERIPAHFVDVAAMPPQFPAQFTDEQLARLQQKADVTPTIVENLGAGVVTHIGNERPSFDEIVRAVAWHFETDGATVRGWIVDAAYHRNCREEDVFQARAHRSA